MDGLLVHLLGETQSSAEAPRTQAEHQLQNLYYDESFPLNLCTIAAQHSLPLAIRQSSLLTLKNFVLTGWSPQIDDFKGQVLVPSANKDAIREALLSLATSGTAERKIQSAASYVVAKIAAADFPDHWGGLLPSLLQRIPAAGDTSLHGTLKVLADLVEDGLNETQFFAVARELVEALYTVVRDEGRNPTLRALAAAVFKGCFDTLEMVLEDHKTAVKTFAEGIIGAWMPLLKTTMKQSLPLADDGQDIYNGNIALKLQAVKVLMKIRMIFPTMIAPQSVELFSTTWAELSTLLPAYQQTYVEDDQEGRLEDADGLPYTLDFLVLEDLDFMQALIRAPPVRKELEAQITSSNGAIRSPQSSWIANVLALVVSYAQITTEEEGLWQVDVNVFLSEETSVTANYTTRTACGDFVVKLGEWLSMPTIGALLSHIRNVFSASNNWRVKEAALYIANQLMLDWLDVPQKIDSAMLPELLEFAHHAIQQPDAFLRARGFVVAAVVVKMAGEPLRQTGSSFLEMTLRSTIEDGAEIVQVSCIRALQHYLSSLPPTYTLPLQDAIISALSRWIATQDLADLNENDDLMITLVETLRDAITLDTRVALTGDGLNLLFNIASKGAANFQIVALVTEVFEEICSTTAALGNESYAQLCHRVLPSLIGAFDTASFEEENPLTNLSGELLTSLTHYATSPLPDKFIETILLKVTPHILHSSTSELLKSGTLSLRYILQNDSAALLSYGNGTAATQESTTSHYSGLETLLHIISHLLSPSVPDAAASEVGGLAAELVEKAGAELLGPFLAQLLKAIAVRLASATHAQLVQSLILVFARLCLTNPTDVVDFLAQLNIQTPTSGSDYHNNDQVRTAQTSTLNDTIATWLTSSSTFVGYAAIKTNIFALANLYRLHDPRIASILVNGDLVPSAAQAGRIMTRSRTKQNPDTWTSVSASVKMLKVLIEELALPGENGAMENAAKGAIGTSMARGPGDQGGIEDDDVNDDDEDDGDYEDECGDWEDEPGVLDLGLGSTKASLMAWAGGEDEDTETASVRGRRGDDDDEVQGFLVAFFKDVVREDGFENSVWPLLTEKEKEKVRMVV